MSGFVVVGMLSLQILDRLLCAVNSVRNTTTYHCLLPRCIFVT